MSEYARVCTLADLANLAPEEVMNGYQFGLHGWPLPPCHTYTRSFWHGWRAGHVDAGLAEPDDAHEMLAEAVARTTRTLH